MPSIDYYIYIYLLSVEIKANEDLARESLIPVVLHSFVEGL